MTPEPVLLNLDLIRPPLDLPLFCVLLLSQLGLLLAPEATLLYTRTSEEDF